MYCIPAIRRHSVEFIPRRTKKERLSIRKKADIGGFFFVFGDGACGLRRPEYKLPKILARVYFMYFILPNLNGCKVSPVLYILLYTSSGRIYIGTAAKDGRWPQKVL